MMVHGSQLNGWMWLFMGAGQIAFWVLLIAAFVLLRRSWIDARLPSTAPVPRDRQSAEQLLAARFANGELDETEYGRRLVVLRQHANVPGTAERPVSQVRGGW